MLWGRRIERTRRGEIRLRLPAGERELLRGLPAELRALLADDPADPSLGRLFPPAYDDDEEEREYRGLVGEELLAGRLEELRTLEETVDRDRLEEEELAAWIGALNDLRLVLGTRLDVQEDTFDDGLDPDDPRARELSLYAYLTWLQQQAVEATAVYRAGDEQ
jgi:hypothetical protein